MARLDELRLNISPALTGIALGYSPGGLIGDKVLPVLPVSGDKARLPKFTIEQLQTIDDTRALRTEPKQVSWGVNYVDVTLEEHSVDSPVDWREIRAGQGIGVDYLAKAARTAKRLVVLAREKNVASVLQDPNSYASGHTETPAGGSGWNEKTGGTSNVDIVDLILQRAEIIRQKTGQRPNVFWCGAEAWSAISRNTYVLNRLAFAPSAISAMRVTEEAFASAIQVDRVIVGGAITSTNGTATEDVWGDYAGLAYVEPNPSAVEAPTFGFLAMEQFGFEPEMLAYGFVSTWNDSGRFVQHTTYTELYKPFIAMPEAGYLWIDVVK